ncbi:MAG: TetR/AcrR family transcriptional regulator [Pseudomonadaceae bacterium]|nr:TetR/AcrR family transcriptional regulator [Pseudomonadaceae bacterium]
MARVRRTPEQARELLLSIAAERLRDIGLKGLNVKDVAAAAGMSHATLLHHFGSAEAMQQALVQRLTQSLVTDLVDALQGPASQEPAEICRGLFTAMARDGHARLAAWVNVTEQALPTGLDQRDLFADLVEALRDRLGLDSLDEARQTVVMVASAAIGFELVRDALPGVVGLSEEQTDSFPAWLVGRLPGISDC